MKILAVDSSAKAASAAIVEDGRIVGECYTDAGLTHSRTLMPMVDGVCRSCDCDIKEIDCFAVSYGPGSFTGIRIGVAAVKGMADSLGKDCLGLSTLEVIAWGLSGLNCIAACAMDARCNQVYAAVFRCENGVVTRLSDDEAITIDEFGARLSTYDEDVFLIGDGAELCFSKISGNNIRLAPSNIRLQHAGCAGLCAFEKLKTEKPVSPSQLVPVYLRLPQAERELKARQKALRKD